MSKTKGCTTSRVISDYKEAGIPMEECVYGMRSYGFDINENRGAATGLFGIALASAILGIGKMIKVKKTTDAYERYFNSRAQAASAAARLSLVNNGTDDEAREENNE